MSVNLRSALVREKLEAKLASTEEFNDVEGLWVSGRWVEKHAPCPPGTSWHRGDMLFEGAYLDGQGGHYGVVYKFCQYPPGVQPVATPLAPYLPSPEQIEEAVEHSGWSSVGPFPWTGREPDILGETGILADYLEALEEARIELTEEGWRPIPSAEDLPVEALVAMQLQQEGWQPAQAEMAAPVVAAESAVARAIPLAVLAVGVLGAGVAAWLVLKRRR